MLLNYVLRRIALAGLTVFIVSVLVFMLVRLLPGDASLYSLEESGIISEEQNEALRRELGIDKPVPEQFVRWFGGIVRGDFGNSFITHGPAVEGLKRGLPATAELVILAWVFSLVLGISTGVTASVVSGSLLDYFARFVAIAGLSIPSFLTGTLFILGMSLVFAWAAPFGYSSPWESPTTNLQQIGPPALLLGFALSGSVMRLTRSSLIEVSRQEYIRTARAKGLSEFRIVTRHQMRNAMIPVVTLSGAQLGRLLGGTVILEAVFVLPGVGTWILNGIQFRDYPVVQAGTLFLASVMVFMNLLADLTVGFIDPRIRY